MSDILTIEMSHLIFHKLELFSAQVNIKYNSFSNNFKYFNINVNIAVA